MEIGVRGFLAKSTTTFLLDFGFRRQLFKGALKELFGCCKWELEVVAEALADYLGW